MGPCRPKLFDGGLDRARAWIVRGIEPARMVVATDAAAYRDRHELVHRRDADAPNEMWQADHTMLDVLVLDAASPSAPG